MVVWFASPFHPYMLPKMLHRPTGDNGLAWGIWPVAKMLQMLHRPTGDNGSTGNAAITMLTPEGGSGSARNAALLTPEGGDGSARNAALLTPKGVDRSACGIWPVYGCLDLAFRRHF
jgi:hypothetical protein